MTPCQTDSSPGSHRIGFLLVPGFSHIAFAGAIEPMRMANMAADRPLFEAVTLSLDGQAVPASNGVRTLPDYTIADHPSLHTLLIGGPNPLIFPEERRLVRWLHRLDAQHTRLGGVDTGSALMARAGLLDGYRCTIHWQDRTGLLSHYPDIIVSDHLYEIDRGRLTSGGGTAAMDMMLHYISLITQNNDITATAAELLVHDRIRIGREKQRHPLVHLIGMARPELRDAVAIMEANIEQPLTIAEVAVHAGLSERQLERLFRDEVGATPKAHYIRLRLETARHQLLHTGDSIADIANGCGFRSNSYFTHCYRSHYDVTPSQEHRRQRD